MVKKFPAARQSANLVWKKSRALKDSWSRSGLRAVALAFCFTPTILFATSPGLHGAIPLPYFAWASLWSGIADHNQQALMFGLVPLAFSLGILWLLFEFLKLP